MTTDEVLTQLAERGLALPDAPAPAGSYVPLRIHGEVGYLAGQFPIVDGKPAVTGRVAVVAPGRSRGATTTTGDVG